MPTVPKTRTAPTADAYEHVPPPHWRPPHPLAHPGVTGPIAPGRAELLQQRRDQDRVRWVGWPIFTRPATDAERALVARHTSDHAGAGSLHTRVDCRGGRWRRSWPLLSDHEPDRDEGAA
jgi:hypothetical protein